MILLTIESLFEEMLQEHDEVVTKRKQTSELFHVLQQAVQTLDEVEADVFSRDSRLGADTTAGLPRIPGLSSNLYAPSNGENKSTYMLPYANSASRKLLPSGEQPLPRNSNDVLH